jgi:ribosomal protein S18 acetylase RimI-like enzyme
LLFTLINLPYFVCLSVSLRSLLSGCNQFEIIIIDFDSQDKIAGGLMAVWYGQRRGVTEDIFVLPPWRRKGIARSRIAEGIQYLAEHEIAIASLEVRESNTPAALLYQSMGYGINNQEEQWTRMI